MKAPIIALVSLLVGLAAGYALARHSHSKELYQQELEADLTSGKVLMNTLQALDSGDLPKARLHGMTSIQLKLSFLSYAVTKSDPTSGERQEIVEFARGALNYMLQHREEWDPRLPSVRGGVNALGRILSDKNDIQRLTELTNYLANAKGGNP